MFKILQLTTYGIKSIEKPITINFSNATTENGPKKVNNVKGIYGYNGAGKSAIIEAVNLYKMIVTKPNYLLDTDNKRRLAKLVNFKTNEFYVSVVFSDDDLRVFKHEIRLKKDLARGGFVIDEETLSESVKRTINEEFGLHISQKNLSWKLREGYELPEYLKSDSLRYSSISSTVYVNAIDEKAVSRTKLEKTALVYLLFALYIEVYLPRSDRHEFLYNPANVESMKDFLDERVARIQSQQGGWEEMYLEEIKVPKNHFKNFEEENRRLEKFIKIFKPSVKSIDLRYRENRELYLVRRCFVYEDYDIDLEFESSGIKQLVNLFPSLNACANGFIVFIDEMDENINSVYLKKLVSFFKEYGKGQLVFTTHNLETMDVLKDQAKAIEVLGDDGKIDYWKQEGNRSPRKYYVGGYFLNSPMNVEDFDFINVFQGED